MLRDIRLEAFFPNLRETGYEITSPEDRGYNCIAWAAKDETTWWWPDASHVYYWPENAPREETVAAFNKAFTLLGFSHCNDARLENDVEKVAVFVDSDGNPTHMARQLATGKWTSKLGALHDIEHALEGLANSAYGTVAAFLSRGRRSSPG